MMRRLWLREPRVVLPPDGDPKRGRRKGRHQALPTAVHGVEEAHCPFLRAVVRLTL